MDNVTGNARTVRRGHVAFWRRPTRNVTAERSRHVWAAAVLAYAVLVVYGQVYAYGFVDYDDPTYVSENPFVLRGLTLEGVGWAFTTGRMGNWHPLTWLSHMLDVQLFGLNPGAHHLVNVALHVGNTLLLFGVLERMTAALWPSLAVAALFAVHPLHVESVAWIAERKDVLSTFFWFLTLWAYVRYVESQSGRWYFLTGTSLALGLMAKPMLVTVPFVLLLLDIWPLGRLACRARAPSVLPDGARHSRRPQEGEGAMGVQRKSRREHRRSVPRMQSIDNGPRAASLAALVWEKAPLLSLTVMASAVAYTMQLRSGAVIASSTLPVGVRAANALVAYVRYLSAAVWPVDLAVLYPYDTALPWWQPLGAAMCIGAVSIIVFGVARRHPYALVGWLWYVGTLVPVIGLVQIGSQALADRYTYVPLVGIFVMLAWGGRSLVARRAFPAPAVAAVVAAAIGAYAVVAWAQVRLWKSSETLLAHTARVTRNNCVAHNNLGIALAVQGKIDAALEQYHEALRIKSDYGEPYNNIGLILMQQGRREEAVAQYRTALGYTPDSAETHNNLGVALTELGRTDEALAELSEALRLAPQFAPAHNNLGNILRDKGRRQEAIDQYEQAVRLKPDYAEAHSSLGAAFCDLGRPQEAIGQFELALRFKPDCASAHNDLGNLLRDTGRRQEAIEHFHQALSLNPNDPIAHNNLGLVLGELRKNEEAIAHFSEAVRLDPQYASAHNNLANALRDSGRLPEAIEQYERALRLQPDNPTAHNNLGGVLVETGRLQDAIEQYQQGISLKPNDPMAHYNLGSALARAGRLPEAIEQYQQVLKLTPEDAEAWSNLAFAYAGVGRPSEAVDAARRALDLARSKGQAALQKTIEHWLSSYSSGLSSRASDKVDTVFAVPLT